MKLRCPDCGFEEELPHFTRAEELLALDRAAAAFGDAWPLMREYLKCFRGKRPLTADKMLRLTREIYPIYQSGKFKFDAVAYVVDRPEFLEALRSTCNQVKPPLTNHHYLFRVLTGAARETSQRRERELKDREKGLGVRGPEPANEAPAVAQDPEFERLVMRSLDMSRSEAERLAAKNQIREINQARNAQHRKDHPPREVPSRREVERKRLEETYEEGELNIAEDLLKLVKDHPTPAEVAEVKDKLADQGWRDTAGNLGKAVNFAKSPVEREAAQAALKAHLATAAEN